MWTITSLTDDSVGDGKSISLHLHTDDTCLIIAFQTELMKLCGQNV